MIVYRLEEKLVELPGEERRQVDGGPVEACSGSGSREAAKRTKRFTGVKKKPLIAEVTQKSSQEGFSQSPS